MNLCGQRVVHEASSRRFTCPQCSRLSAVCPPLLEKGGVVGIKKRHCVYKSRLDALYSHRGEIEGQVEDCVGGDRAAFSASRTDVRVVPFVESHYSKACDSLVREIQRVYCEPDAERGRVRIEVPLCRGISSLQWLKSQNIRDMKLYFSSKMSSSPDTAGSIAAESAFAHVSAVAGVGAAWMWKGLHGCSLDEEVMESIKRMTDDDDNRVRAFGGGRFDPGGNVAAEWEVFGSFCFLIPRVEFVERGNVCVLACTIAWDSQCDAGMLASAKTTGFRTKEAAIEDALLCVSKLAGPLPRQVSGVCSRGTCVSSEHNPTVEGWNRLLEEVQDRLCAVGDVAQGEHGTFSISPSTALDEYLRNGQKGLDDLLAASSPNVGVGQSDTSGKRAQDLAKLVLARRTAMVIDEEIDCCDVLGSLQERDPKAYQFLLQMPNGQCFLGCTPERLYARSGQEVVSEAVAGTRGRGAGGDIEKDFWLAFDLLQSQKDGLEFQLVRESIVDIFNSLCSRVTVEVEKSVLKQGSVQHLYGRIAGTLESGVDDLDLLNDLHPTPAVCGQPDKDALCFLRQFESFDRGFYAGPFGWFTNNAADVAVAIRSSLISPGSDQTLVSLYAGVGIVPGSVTMSEWNELDLKIGQFTKIFDSSTEERILKSPNMSLLSAQVMVEELCRNGCNTFCVAPGSRSSPLTLAVARHPRAKLVPGIDERSLGFWAVGYGKATGHPCVVITSSGTAVANLLPSVVEASQSNVPMILLTADRPSELRDSGANQTINQVGIFGKYVRWEADILPPSDTVPVRKTLTAVSNAIRVACSPSSSGPVHLNCQYREPLHPVQDPWDDLALEGLHAWLGSTRPFTSISASYSRIPRVRQVDHTVIDAISNCRRGLLVVGELAQPEDVAAAKHIAKVLGWPVVCDVLSGLRIGDKECEDMNLINYIDHILLDQEIWGEIEPEMILHLGSRLTSKRLAAFIEHVTLDANERGDPGPKWILVDRKTPRYDPSHLLQMRLECDLSDLLDAIQQGHRQDTSIQSEYGSLLRRINDTVEEAIDRVIEESDSMSEAHVARAISEYLPSSHGLFIGNSMPIRDLDMFGAPQRKDLLGSPVAANRGASGIDGVLSSAAGFASGLLRKCTLVVGDVSFLHDANGLNLLRTGSMSPALTVVLINNSGGGIFDFLPISDDVPEDQFRPLWTTPQYVDISGLCRAQGIPHMKVSSLTELRRSLESSWELNRHCVVEVITNIETNVQHHEFIKSEVKEALARYLSDDVMYGTIKRVRLNRVSLPLKKALTTALGSTMTYREVIHITMDLVFSDGTSRKVIGEIAPLPGLHKETLESAMVQSSSLARFVEGSNFSESPTMMALEKRIPALNDFLQDLGIEALYPSVTCGMEAAIWEALSSDDMEASTRPPTKVSGLLDPSGKSEVEIRDMAASLVNDGYQCIKVKAGRVEDPREDAKNVMLIREAVGNDIILRVDTNQSWTVEQALIFAETAKDVGIQYIEEPLKDPWQMHSWSTFSTIPLAIDESVDQGLFNPLDPSCDIPSSVKFVVLKPSLLGGMTKTVELCDAIRSCGRHPVISSSFESPIGLLHLSKISSIVDTNRELHHGIATESWFAEDFSQLAITRLGQGRAIMSSVSLSFSKKLMSGSKSEGVIIPTCSSIESTSNIEWNIMQVYPHIHSQAFAKDGSSGMDVVLLLHGMFGSGNEMASLALELSKCSKLPILCLDLPGHGGSRWKNSVDDMGQHGFQMMDILADSLVELAGNFRSCSIIGYSLGARIALLTSLRHPSANLTSVISISGGLGIQDVEQRADRFKRDCEIAAAFDSLDRSTFFRMWYDVSLWDSLRDQCWFDEYIKEKASSTPDPENVLSDMLRECSPGRTSYMKDELLDATKHPGRKIFMVAGSDDTKYTAMVQELEQDAITAGSVSLSVSILEDVGHAMHLENPSRVATICSNII